jgi:hypothetical protein
LIGIATTHNTLNGIRENAWGEQQGKALLNHSWVIWHPYPNEEVFVESFKKG